MGFDRYRRFGGSPLAISSGGDGVVSVADRLAGHVASARPQVALRASLAASSATALLPRGAGAGVDAGVARLRPTAPAVEPTVERTSTPTPAPVPTADLATIVPITAARRHPNRVRKVAAATALGLAVAGSGVLPSAALPVVPGSDLGFEQDGDMSDQGGNTAIDWETATDTVTVFDDGGDVGFQGSSKELFPEDWTCQTKVGGIAPPKDNLLRGYVNVRYEDDTAVLDLGIVKAEGEGDTHVNFEFNQDGSKTGDCGIVRRTNDFMVAFDYGGTSFEEALVRLFQWNGSTWIERTDFEAQAANNTVDITDLVEGGTLEYRTFSELTVRLPEDLLTCPGYGKVNIRSRSAAANEDSNSIFSALQDWLPPTDVDVSSCAKVKLNKVDDLGNALAGATFGLFQGDVKKYECVTDGAGLCTFLDVAPGTYTVREIDAPDGYEMDPHSESVTVGFRDSITIEYVFENPLILGALKIVKTDSAGNLVEGITFELRTGTAQADDRNGDPAECTTDDDGVCVMDELVPGTYTLHEDPTTVPDGMSAVADQQVTIQGDVQTVVEVENPLDDLDIDIDKTVDQALVTPGTTVTYTLVITNTGEVDLTLTDLSDVVNDAEPVLPGGTCAALEGTILEAGDDVSCTYDSVIEGATVNTAKVVGTDVFGRTTDDQDDAEVKVFVPAPHIDIQKTVDGGELARIHPGDTVTYRLVITNDGDSTLTITDLDDLTDDGVVVDLPEECTDLIGTVLEVGDDVACEYEGAPTDDVVNTASVEGEDERGTKVTDEDDAAVEVISPAITIIKTVNNQESVTVHAGDTVTYRLYITNTGTIPLTITSLTDVAGNTAVDLPAACDGLVGQVLVAGGTRECSYTAVAGTAPLRNVATVTGVDELDKEVKDDDDARYNVINPAITIVKTGTPTAITGDSGEVTFTYLVTNTGDTTLFEVKVTDDILGEIGTVARLEPGQSTTLTKTATVSSSVPRNVGTATGRDTLGKQVTANDDEVITFALPTVVEPAPPVEPAPAPVPVARTGAETGRLVQIALVLMLVGGLAVLPERLRLKRSE